MAEPRVFVLEDSFIRRLRLFLSRDSHHFSVDFKLSHRAFIKWHGVGGRTVSKTLHLDLNVIESFRPEIVIMQFFNRKAKLLTKYLRAVLEPIPYAIFWGHRGFWRPTPNFYARDGVYLNSLGQGKYRHSLRGAILRSLSLFSTISSC